MVFAVSHLSHRIKALAVKQSACEADPNRLHFDSLILLWQLLLVVPVSLPLMHFIFATNAFHFYCYQVMSALIKWPSVDPVWQYCFILLKGEQMHDMNWVAKIPCLGSEMCTTNRGDVLAQKSELTLHQQQSRAGQLCHKGQPPLCDITTLISRA